MSTERATEARRIALAQTLRPILLQAEHDILGLHPRGTPLSHAPLFLADRLDAAGIGVAAPPPLDGLREAALALFDPMEHGSPVKPNPGHTPETYCAECVSLRARRTKAIRRALVAVGAMPSLALRDEGETT